MRGPVFVVSTGRESRSETVHREGVLHPTA